VEDISTEAEAAGLAIHWGRKVLEVRPPVPVDKGLPVRQLVKSFGVTRALFGGDDMTDLDAFAALDDLVESGDLEVAIRVGVHSEDGPLEIVERADIAVEGTQGFASLLTVLAEP
jgi:trehalose 6-phosphate phosphatase